MELKEIIFEGITIKPTKIGFYKCFQGRKRKNYYQLKSTVSGEKLHKGWITEDEVKKILIERQYWDSLNNSWIFQLAIR